MTTDNTQAELDEILAKHGAEPGEMTHSLKQAILRWVADEIVGEISQEDSNGRYNLKTEQRKILAQHGYKGAIKC